MRLPADGGATNDQFVAAIASAPPAPHLQLGRDAAQQVYDQLPLLLEITPERLEKIGRQVRAEAATQ